MGKGLIIGIVVIVILAILGAGVFLMLNSRNSSPTTTNTEELVKTQESTAQTGNGTIRDLLAATSPQACSFKDMNSQTSGVLFIANSQMRGDFSSAGPQGSTDSHMIVDGNTAYVWMAGEPSGFQISLDMASTASEQAETIEMGIDRQVDYTCTTWTVDETVFTRPPEVTFTDFSSMVAP